MVGHAHLSRTHQSSVFGDNFVYNTLVVIPSWNSLWCHTEKQCSRPSELGVRPAWTQSLTVLRAMWVPLWLNCTRGAVGSYSASWVLVGWAWERLVQWKAIQIHTCRDRCVYVYKHTCAHISYFNKHPCIHKKVKGHSAQYEAHWGKAIIASCQSAGSLEEEAVIKLVIAVCSIHAIMQHL